MINFIPEIIFKTRVRDETIKGENRYKWKDKTTDDHFKHIRAILFSLQVAFIPTRPTYQLPNFEKLFNDFKTLDADKIYCLSVNDALVMNTWAKSQNLKNVEVIPDGYA